jgi:eukaryotic-like serine/threonine-protein kinase
LDFGLAKVTKAKLDSGTAITVATLGVESAELTSPGTALGTVCYMSPEQVLGKELDARTDLFSFGIILYEMATGLLPFQGESSGAIFDSILHKNPVAPARLNTGLPVELERLIHKAIEKDRSLRSQSAAEMRTDLKRLKRDTDSAWPTIKPNQVRLSKRFSPRSRWAFAVLVILAASLYLLKTHGLRPIEKKQAIQRELTANPIDDPILFAVISPDGRQLASLDRANGLSLLQIDSGEKRSFTDTASVAPMGWFPDGTHLLIERLVPINSRGLWKMSTVDGSSRKLLDESFIPSAAVSPDGTRIAFIKGPTFGEIWVMGAAGEDPHRILSIEPSFAGSLGWSSTSQRIAFTSVKGPIDNPQEVALESCDRDGRQRSILLSNIGLQGRDGPTAISWSADGRIFYRLTEHRVGYGNVWSMDVDPDTGRVRREPSQVTSGTGFSQNGFSQAADGKRLTFVRERDQDTIRVAEIQSAGKKLGASQPLGGDNWDKWLSGWMHDSRAVIFASNPQQKWGIFKQDVRSRERQSLVVGSDRYGDAVVSPDGQWLLFTQTSPDGHPGEPTRLMRMPINGGPATLVLSGTFSFRCASQTDVCVLFEVLKDQRILSLFDPLKGRGPKLTQADVAWNDYGWSLSADGKKISMLLNSDPSRIEILDTQGSKNNPIQLKGWQVQCSSWSPDNQHLYVSGVMGSGFSVALISLDGKVMGLLDVPLGQGWPTALQPSPDGHYLGYVLRLFDANVAMLENY